MKQARGKIKEILLKVGDIQAKVGLARELHFDDQSQNSFSEAQILLKDAFGLCLEIRGEYYPVDPPYNKTN